MSTKRIAFGERPTPPGTAGEWIVRGVDVGPRPAIRATPTHSARLTIDVTPDLRGRIKVEAFRRGATVATLLRELLEREFMAASPVDGGMP